MFVMLKKFNSAAPVCVGFLHADFDATQGIEETIVGGQRVMTQTLSSTHVSCFEIDCD
jgi:hypothetical protein